MSKNMVLSITSYGHPEMIHYDDIILESDNLFKEIINSYITEQLQDPKSTISKCVKEAVEYVITREIEKAIE